MHPSLWNQVNLASSEQMLKSPINLLKSKLVFSPAISITKKIPFHKKYPVQSQYKTVLYSLCVMKSYYFGQVHITLDIF